MQFKPKSEEECNRFETFPKGNYDFEVIEAADKISKERNEMIELKIAIYNEQNRRSQIFDYLLEKMAYKLRHFCGAAGLMEHYEAGTLTAHMCVGKTGVAEIGIQKATTQYKEKNVVVDYLLDGAKQGEKTEASTSTQDDLPF